MTSGTISTPNNGFYKHIKFQKNSIVIPWSRHKQNNPTVAAGPHCFILT